jgi:cyclopropane fatty-acyl-phospholipid synthase-like methyltransferase
VLETVKKYGVARDDKLLEIGCGEGRDARAVLDLGYSLTATDISQEAITYCQKIMPHYKQAFQVLDCLSGEFEGLFDFIYGVAVVHMLVLDKDRDGFYQFIYRHLKDDGLALICTMGDGEFEKQSDIRQAFDMQEREHESGKIKVAGTSCRMVCFKTFEEELARNDLKIIEKGITSAMPDFNNLMYVVAKKEV